MPPPAIQKINKSKDIFIGNSVNIIAPPPHPTQTFGFYFISNEANLLLQVRKHFKY